jgi:hypothetical protein
MGYNAHKALLVKQPASPMLPSQLDLNGSTAKCFAPLFAFSAGVRSFAGCGVAFAR